jgi:ABC-type amino acid transport substrate-binding protein
MRRLDGWRICLGLFAALLPLAGKPFGFRAADGSYAGVDIDMVQRLAPGWA